MMVQNPHIAEAERATRQAVADGFLTEPAGENILTWLTESAYEPWRSDLLEHIEGAKWKALDDVFWTIIPFGTGGRRGRMYPIGTNAINDRTIGESAQGLADYLHANQPGIERRFRIALAYDTRHKSRHFAELCSGILAANGCEIFFLNGHRSTPELSFAVRYLNCDAGIMVTASHNPPTDNAVKIYWSTGGQLLPPHDAGIIKRVMQVSQIRSMAFDEALSEGLVTYCESDVDAEFIAAVSGQASEGPRALKILYTPLHGVGATAVVPALKAAGFQDIEIYGPHAEADPDFSNVPGNMANPENPAVFAKPIEYAKANGFDIVLATDPDADRLGIAVPVSGDLNGPWQTLSGNQIGSLLADDLLGARQAAGTLSSDDYLLTTLVTTRLIDRIAAHYGVGCHSDLHVGFKNIAGAMDRYGPDHFVFGCEESFGYLAGQYARDKDGAVASLLTALLAARLKSQGVSLPEKLDQLMQQHGCHVERPFSVQMPGSEGMRRMMSVMESFRTDPPKTLGGLKIIRVTDYLNLKILEPGKPLVDFEAEVGDFVLLELEEPGNSVGVRPSGTEPKIKFYSFAYAKPSESQDLTAARKRLNDRLQAIDADLKSFAGV